MPSSLAAKGKDHPAAWWIWTVNKDSSPVGLATTWVYRTLPQLSPMARFVSLYLWLSKLAISGHNEVSFSYGLQVSALNMFNTRNPAISIVRILHCVIVFYKVASVCMKTTKPITASCVFNNSRKYLVTPLFTVFIIHW